MRPDDSCLFVDLDGCLIKTDLLLESLFLFIRRHPLRLLKVFAWCLRGKACLKARLAEYADELDAALLPYNGPFLTYLREQRATGRRLVLTTGAHKTLADRVARYLGVFDSIIATSDEDNVAGARKLECIRTYCAGLPFDYAGNSRVDLAIWPSAREAIVVSATPGVLARARALGHVTRVFELPRAGLLELAKELRIHQWLKNVLVFIPLVAGHQLGELASSLHAVFAFIAFGLCASGVYVLNDLLDLQSDRQHPRKRNRPFASGTLSLKFGVVLAVVLPPVAFAFAASVLPVAFVLVLAIYLATTLAYSLWAKNRVIVDVLFLAGLYTLRIIGGAAATGIELSFWLLAFSTFLFLSLALVKRYSEMIGVRNAGKRSASGRDYSVADMSVLQSLGTSSGLLAVLVLALYINSPEVHVMYRDPRMLWLLCPVLLYWVSRIWMKSHRGELHDDPVVFAATDRASQLCMVLCAGGIVLAV